MVVHVLGKGIYFCSLKNKNPIFQLMDSVNIIGIVLTSGGLIFLLAGWIQFRFPPKKINHLYGYRTSTSMRNLEGWAFAQRYSARRMIRLGTAVATLGSLAWLFDFQSVWAIWIALSVLIVSPLVMMLQIEMELKKRFPKSE